MEEKKIVVYVLHGFWENEFTNGCAVVDVSIDLETVMKKLDEIVENKAREYVKVQEDKAEEERGFRYFEIWDENGQSAKFYIVEQYLELSQSMIWHREDWYLEDLEEAIRSTGLEVTQERVDKLLEECHRIFDDKSGRNEMLAQKASKLFEEE